MRLEASTMSKGLKDRSNPGLRWIYYPTSDGCPDQLQEVARLFADHHGAIDSFANRRGSAQSSDEVLAAIAEDLRDRTDFVVETGKDAKSKISVPVLYGLNGRPQKTYEVDAWHKELGAVLEVEAGGAVQNFKFLKDLFEAIVMDGIRYLILAVQNRYYSTDNDDFETISGWFDVAYASGRFELPLEGILLIGY